jgi:hypothetical protein
MTSNLPICSITGLHIQQGFYFYESDFYCSSKKDAKSHAIKLGFKNLKESYNAGAHYWTTWEEDM